MPQFCGARHTAPAPGARASRSPRHVHETLQLHRAPAHDAGAAAPVTHGSGRELRRARAHGLGPVQVASCTCAQHEGKAHGGDQTAVAPTNIRRLRAHAARTVAHFTPRDDCFALPPVGSGCYAAAGGGAGRERNDASGARKSSVAASESTSLRRGVRLHSGGQHRRQARFFDPVRARLPMSPWRMRRLSTAHWHRASVAMVLTTSRLAIRGLSGWALRVQRLPRGGHVFVVWRSGASTRRVGPR